MNVSCKAVLGCRVAGWKCCKYRCGQGLNVNASLKHIEVTVELVFGSDGIVNIIDSLRITAMIPLPRPIIPPTTLFFSDTACANVTPWHSRHVPSLTCENDKTQKNHTENENDKRMSLFTKYSTEDQRNSGARCKTAPPGRSLTSYPDDIRRKVTSAQHQKSSMLKVRKPSSGNLQERVNSSLMKNVMYANKIHSRKNSELFEVIDLDHIEDSYITYDTTDQKSAELTALQDKILVKQNEFILMTEEYQVILGSLKKMEDDIQEVKENISKADGILARSQRTVEKLSSINMMLIDTLDALELQPSTDEGPLLCVCICVWM